MTPTFDTCPECGREVPADSRTQGLCPRCLIKGVLGGPPTRSSSARRPGFVPPTPAELADLLPSLRIDRLVGQGGMGAVYQGQQPALGRAVAIKVVPLRAVDPADDLTPDAAGVEQWADAERDAAAERFRLEAQALARLSHPNVVAVHDCGRVGDLGYLVMEFVAGISLRQRMNWGPLPLSEAVAVAKQACEALGYAHRRGVIHRDVKPENILLPNNPIPHGSPVVHGNSLAPNAHPAGVGPSTVMVKVADFGLAKLVGPADGGLLTLPDERVGTPAYAAPEQSTVGGAVDARADLFSLGVVLYEMLTGRRPAGLFDPPSRLMPAPPPPVLAARLDAVVMRCLAADRDRRFDTADELRFALESLDVAALPYATPARAPWRRVAVVAALVAGAALVLLPLAFLVGRRGGPGGVLAVGPATAPATQPATAPATMPSTRRVPAGPPRPPYGGVGPTGRPTWVDQMRADQDRRMAELRARAAGATHPPFPGPTPIAVPGWSAFGPPMSPAERVQQMATTHGKDRVATVHVDDLPGDVGSFVLDRLRAVTRAGESFRLTTGGRSVTVHLAPVPDLDALAKGIDFGTVTKTDSAARAITVRADAAKLPTPLPPAVTSPADPRFVERNLADLDLWDARRRRSSLDRLKGADPGKLPAADRARVVAVLRKLADDADGKAGDLRPVAVEALGTWGDDEDLPRLLALADGSDPSLSREATEAVAALKTLAAAQALAGRLSRERSGPLGRALSAMGPVAEPAVLAKLNDPRLDDWTRASAAEVLEKVGTAKSLPELEKAAASEGFFLKTSAKRASDAIRKRAGGGA